MKKPSSLLSTSTTLSRGSVSVTALSTPDRWRDLPSWGPGNISAPPWQRSVLGRLADLASIGCVRSVVSHLPLGHHEVAPAVLLL